MEEENINCSGEYALFRRVICCSGGLYGCPGGLCATQGVICCSGGLYAVQEGYFNVQEGCIMFRGVICCSGGLYGCSGGLYIEENNDVYSARTPTDWNANHSCQFSVPTLKDCFILP